MTDAIALWLSERLVAASIQGAGIIALVWLVCRSLSSLPAPMRAALWWLAALKLVMALLPVPAVPIPLLPAAFDWTGDRPSPAMTGQGAAVIPVPTDVVPAHAPIESDAVAADAGRRRWLEAVILLWLGIVVLQAARLLIAFRELRGVVRRSVPDADDGAVDHLANLIGLSRAPQVRASGEIAAPLVAGLWRPVVLVPAGVATLSAEERAMALCHELMHIRRRDLALGWMPALAERLFFFHPLARLAAREYVTARESACDAAVVRALGVSPSSYGRMLVRLGVTASTPAFTAAGAPPSMSSLRRRLEMLQHVASPYASHRWAWSIVIVAGVLIPLQLVAGPPAGQQAPAHTSRAAVAAASRSQNQATPVETSAPDRSAPVETAPDTPPAEAASQQAQDAILRESERLISELVRRQQDAAALQEKADEYFASLQRQRAAERESLETAMKAQLESANQRMQESINRAIEENAQARRKRLEMQSAAEQDATEARVKMLELMELQRQASGALDAPLGQVKQQLEMLARQLQQIAKQQDQLAIAQRQLADLADTMRRISEDVQRLRKELEAR